MYMFVKESICNSNIILFLSLWSLSLKWTLDLVIIQMQIKTLLGILCFLQSAITEEIILNKLPPSLSFECTSISNNTNLTLQLSNCDNNQYMGYIGVGTPSQNMSVLFDTGSTILWIPMYPCSGCQSSKYYNSSASPTYNNSQSPMSISYVDGTQVNGSYGSQIVMFSNSPINIRTGVLFVTSQADISLPSNGIVGLGFTTTYPNFFDNAYSANQIKTSTFALSLSSGTSIVYYNQLPSWLESSTYFVDWYSNSNSAWQVQNIGFQAGGIDFSIVASSAVIIDSGTSLFYLNPSLFSSLYTEFFSNCSVYSNYLLCDCGTYTPVTLSIFLNGIIVFLYPQNYTRQQGNSCYLQFGVINDNFILLGDTFFRNYIVTFNKLQSQVGFSGNFTLLNLIGQNALTYLLGGQIAMASICGLLCLVVIILLCMMWSMRTVNVKNNSLETELRAYVIQ